ncbi:hypothetical protein K7X08_007155 [Anisodus acutangulus]|uniref:Uncharacterized protein n=1 Tax=Anisodus acutangulus TaxID=402998 RepID=A0A9Q1LCL6_9SOLA|nr:hypothetical protein K7X08_007155 [Anisodus acutangulus]
MCANRYGPKSGCGFLLENNFVDSSVNSSNTVSVNNRAFKSGPSFGSLFDDNYKSVSVKGGISGSDTELQDTDDSHASMAKDQGRVGVTAPEGSGNKRPREAEDVNWDKRRRLKMIFYYVAKGLYLSQTKDLNYEPDILELQDSKVADYPELNVPDLQNSGILDVEPRRSKDGTKTCSRTSSLYG